MTVTAAYLLPSKVVFFHQMVLDCVERDSYILQNTSIPYGGIKLEIPLSNEYYAHKDKALSCPNDGKIYKYCEDNIEMRLVNEELENMLTEKWYLYPTAYSLKLKKSKLPETVA